MRTMVLISTHRRLSLLAGILIAVGCGGGGGGSTGGGGTDRAAISFTVDWPERSRAPQDAESVKVELFVNGEVVGASVLNRPNPTAAGQSHANFPGLTPGPITTRVSAYTAPNQGGDFLGQSETTSTFTSGHTGHQGVSMSGASGGFQVTTSGVPGTGGVDVGIN